MLKRKIIVINANLEKHVFKQNSFAKVLKFKQKNLGVLSDDDISCLLVSVVNLIKNNAYKKAEIKFKTQLEYYQSLLNLNVNRVQNLETQIKALKSKNS